MTKVGEIRLLPEQAPRSIQTGFLVNVTSDIHKSQVLPRIRASSLVLLLMFGTSMLAEAHYIQTFWKLLLILVTYEPPQDALICVPLTNPCS